MTGCGAEFTRTGIGLLVAVQPLPSITETAYEPEVTTVMVGVVAPVVQVFPDELLLSRMTLPPPQKVVGPSAVIVTRGNGFTVTLMATLVVLQPLPLRTVTL